MSIHERIVIYDHQCDQCDSKYTYKQHLQTHKESVHEGVKYTCNQCDSKFAHKHHLQSHKTAMQYMKLPNIHVIYVNKS